MRLPGATYAISDTGPLISCLQSDSFHLAEIIAERIANLADSHNPSAKTHLGEAQAIALALREGYQNDLLLMDELAARAIAKEEGVKLSGFPGVLLMATRTGIISAEDMRERLELCRTRGTHYSLKFIQQVYKMGKQNRRK